MREDEIQKFLEQYSKGDYTSVDHQRFIDWLHTASPEKVGQIAGDYRLMIEESEFVQGNPQLISSIESAIDRYELSKERKYGNSILTSIHAYYKLTAAAAILVIMAAGAWYLFAPKKIQLQTITHKKASDILPGGNKAMLTLADGSTILLDSAANGNLASQGKTRVIKLDGQLAYAEAGNNTEVFYNTISTPIGGQYQVVLADGSKVWLNAASNLRFPTAFTGAERSVELAGEAYFEVSRDAAKPFMVVVNGMKVEVLGTHFNINSYIDEGSVKTTLLEGSVKISNKQGNRFLKPGQQGQTNETGGLIVLNDVDLDQVMAWKNGEFNFNNADLQTVMRQLARWYDVEVVYEGKLSKREFGGEIQRDLNLSEVLKLLEKNNVHFRVEGKKLVVIP